MKKELLVFLLLLRVSFVGAQENIYTRVVTLLNEQGINTNNKLVAINVWSIGDNADRETNKAFNKTVKTFCYAKLKGGSKGLVVVALNRDNADGKATIALNKDGASQLILLKQNEMPDIGAHNLVFDSKGELILKDLASDKVFSSIHQLITR